MNNKLVFTFPGQGSFHLPLLRHLYDAHRPLRRFFYVVDEVSGDVLGVPFLPLVLGGKPEQDSALAHYPDLDQLGIYLSGYAAAQFWLQMGARPDLLLGHSFGELAAFAVAGIYSFEEGARIVCQRVLSLRANPYPGMMAAISAPAARVQDALGKFAKLAVVSVVNHPGQTVVSGPESEISQLNAVFAREGVSVTVLKSRYPFHSPLLDFAGRAFGIALRGHRFGPAAYPVFIGITEREADHQTDFADAMAQQLVIPLNFESGLRRLFASGYTRFLECGGGTIVTKIVGSILKSEPGHQEWASFPPGADFKEHLRTVSRELLQPVPVAAAAPSRVSEPQPRPAIVAAHQPVPAPQASVRPQTSIPSPEPCDLEPIAIVSMGCVLPGGANNPDEYWKNITTGVSGIVDLTALDPHAQGDFVAGEADGATQRVVSDKTYTLLNGSITGIEYSSELLREFYSREEFNLLAKGQKILALAVAQARLRNQGKSLRAQCILGSTADGWMELDEAHFAASVRGILNELPEPPERKEDFAGRMREALPGWDRAPEEFMPHPLCASVVQTILGIPPAGAYLVDSACSSSLYSLALGARALRSHEVDVVYAGGVFAPGPANNNFFAQFRGLTAHESRPLDAKADGVVFGDGAGIVGLKRLSDAIAAGDVIHGVIRAVGFSSDGKSPSINVPQSEGQKLAILAAYEKSGIDPLSVQYVEAHATSTPVGDAVEFKALREVMGSAHAAPRYLGSVKSLIGHTGWTSGVASVIKICKGLEHQKVPKQFGYAKPNPNIQLEGSGFVIPMQEVDWPQNMDGLPRRAACNSFGFGGTNAHIVIDQYVEPYHAPLSTKFVGKPAAAPDLVIVATEGIFPDGGGAAFKRAALRMPSKRPVLPDVAEHMDASQYLAAMAAEKATSQFPDGALKGALRIGVALGLESKTERGVRANERVFLDRLERVARSVGASPETLANIRAAVVAKVIPSGPYTLPGLMPNVAASRITHTFNWRGPNIVVDRGVASLAQALDAGVKFVSAGDCDVALAGAVNAWAGHGQQAREGAVLVALASAATAEKHKLPVLARLQPGSGVSDARAIPIDAADTAYRGATGLVELLDAIRETATKSIPATIVSNGGAVLTVAPQNGAAPATPPKSHPVPTLDARSSHAFVQDVPITNYTHVLTEAPAAKAPNSLSRRSYLFLVDQPEAWLELSRETALSGLSYKVAAPAGVDIPGAIALDASSEDSLRESLTRLSSEGYDTLVAVKHLSFFADEDLLLHDFDRTRALLDLMFGICRHRYQDIGAKRCAVAALCVGALRSGELDAFTGLFGGFIKSLARELPDGACRAIATDEKRIFTALGQAVSEIESADKIVEVAYRQGKRLRTVLTESALHRAGEPWVNRDSVVLATGGGRGVTAVLVQQLLETYGCTVISLGRTDPADVPAAAAHLDVDGFKQYESQFYREQLAKDGSRKMPELKKLYERYQASHEVACTIRRCRDLPGKYEYVQCDINNAASIDGVVADVLAKYGTLDVVVHGAGVQVSKIMPRKQLADFQRTVSTKLASLSHLYRSCHQRGLHQSVSFHLLTSAFSYLGNDGQPDYGAANEAMNRMAAQFAAVNPKRYWSSMAWLGWAGIGMTRGTEYAALAASRRLRGVTFEEGQRIFADAMMGPPASPINILLTQGEIAFYAPLVGARPRVAPNGSLLNGAAKSSAANGISANGSPANGVSESKKSTHISAEEGVVEWPLSLETMPFLSHHVVRGVPTLPGSFIIAMAGDAAQRLAPGLKIVQFERTRFLRLVRAQQSQPSQVRAVSRIVEATDRQTVVQVQILMDFVHKTGRVLGKDLLHTEIYVRMAPCVNEAFQNNGHSDGAVQERLPDPYVMEGSPVRLDGAFRTMKEVVVSKTTRRAQYKLNSAAYDSKMDHLLPNVILVDAFWRFGTVRSSGRGLSVYVPERCDAMKVFFDYSDFSSELFHKPITFYGANPRPEGDVLHVGPIDAYDADGRMLLRVEGGLCRKFGEIEAN